jgi:hypothetical protein
MPPPPQVWCQVFGTQHLLVFDQLPRSSSVDPETGGDQNHQRKPEQKSTLPFQAGFTQQLFQTAIIDHRITLTALPPPGSVVRVAELPWPRFLLTPCRYFRPNRGVDISSGELPIVAIRLAHGNTGRDAGERGWADWPPVET